MSKELLNILGELCRDERNSVFVLSGKPKSLIDKWFSKVDKLGLGAEYGYHFRTTYEKEWRVADLAQGTEWKEKIKKIFMWYKGRTDGSDLEIKDNSLVWLYKECDPEYGEWQANDLTRTLKAALLSYPEITIVHGKGYVEVKPKNLTKGELAQSFINEVQEKRGYVDFVFCIGDDIGDEEMFDKVDTLTSPSPRSRKNILNDKQCSAFTCTVGRKPSQARYFVNTYQDTVAILSEMKGWSEKVFYCNIIAIVAQK